MVRLGRWLRVRTVHPFGLVGQCQLFRESFTTCIAGTTHFKTNVKLCKTNYVITFNGLVSWMGFHPWNRPDQLSKSRFLVFGFGCLFHWNTDTAIAFFSGGIIRDEWWTTDTCMMLAPVAGSCGSSRLDAVVVVPGAAVTSTGTCKCMQTQVEIHVHPHCDIYIHDRGVDVFKPELV